VVARISSPSLGAASYQQEGTWTAAVSHRWQYSDKHFVGDVEQVYREREGSQVINDINVVDLSVSYAVTKRINLTLGVPFQFATRSQAIRDTRRDPVTKNLINPSPFPAPDGTVNGAVIDRYETSAYGLGDIKLLATMWLLGPDHNKKHNISAGLGVLFPTGEKDAKDTFKTFGTDANGQYQPGAVTQNVDNSIQPGSGAWGIIFDLYAFQELFENFNVFAAGTYIATPERDAGVISGNLNAANPTIWSVNDSYLARAGFGYTFWPKCGLTFTLGGRLEGAPVHDLIGSSGGRRRPGYAVSIEPGIVFTKNRWFASFSTPVALYRNRPQSAVETTGGDAAFADFMTLFTVGRSF
jgi:hypothetical protein